MTEFEGDVLVSNAEIITVFSPDHQLHCGQVEFLGQQLMPSFEKPERAALILQALDDHGLAAIDIRRRASVELGLVHDLDYLRALQGICEELGDQGAAILPSNWTGGIPRARAASPPTVRLGNWSRDTYTSVGGGTFRAATGSARSVVVALEELLLRGKGGAFALSRPPHHHAGRNYMGGYCYLNGAALAAMHCKQLGVKAVVIDVDYHHGNGTQDILYRSDMLFCSIHGDPASNFPYFTGFADELGEAGGEGFNLNLPLEAGADWGVYSQALAHVLDRARAYGPDLAIVSLGVDTFKGDPVGGFALLTDDYSRMGQAFRRLGVPTLFVMEGGYAVEEIGLNVAKVLTGFLG